MNSIPKTKIIKVSAGLWQVYILTAINNDGTLEYERMPKGSSEVVWFKTRKAAKVYTKEIGDGIKRLSKEIAKQCISEQS